MDLEHWLLCKYKRVAMNRENCINRNITIASAIISGVNILTFYNAFYKCFKFKYVDDFISLLCLLFSLMILINIKQHIRTIEFCLWYSILFIILLCRINILNGFFEIDFLKNIASIIIMQFTTPSGLHSVLERPFSEANGRPFLVKRSPLIVC